MQWHNNTWIIRGEICLPNRKLDHTIKSTNGNTVNITLKDANVSKVSKDRVLAKTQATDYNLSGIT